MTHHVVIASANTGKLREFEALLPASELRPIQSPRSWSTARGRMRPVAAIWKTPFSRRAPMLRQPAFLPCLTIRDLRLTLWVGGRVCIRRATAGRALAMRTEQLWFWSNSENSQTLYERGAFTARWSFACRTAATLKRRRLRGVYRRFASRRQRLRLRSDFLLPQFSRTMAELSEVERPH